MSSKRVRGRGGGRNSGRRIAPFKNHVFDSSGPGARVRGTVGQVFEKYLALARDATVNGDHIAAEGYYQHAEHYHRLHSTVEGGGQAGRGRGEQKVPAPERPAERAGTNGDGGDGGESTERAAAGPGNGKDAFSESAQLAEEEAREPGVGSETTEPDQTPV